MGPKKCAKMRTFVTERDIHVHVHTCIHVQKMYMYMLLLMCCMVPMQARREAVNQKLIPPGIMYGLCMC